MPAPAPPLWSLLLSTSFGIALVAGGLAISHACFREWSLAQASTRWPSVHGTIIVAKEHKNRMDQSLEVLYAYSYASVDYTNKNIVFGFDPIDLSSAGNPSRGSSVMVYLDPDRPENSVLVPGGAGETFPAPLFGVFLSVFGAIVAVICSSAVLKSWASFRSSTASK